jgi:hypothetical protein
MTNFFPDNIDEPHLAEFSNSAIADDIVALNFRPLDGSNENELDEAIITTGLWRVNPRMT